MLCIGSEIGVWLSVIWWWYQWAFVRCHCNLPAVEFGNKSQCEFLTAGFGSKFSDFWQHMKRMGSYPWLKLQSVPRSRGGSPRATEDKCASTSCNRSDITRPRKNWPKVKIYSSEVNLWKTGTYLHTSGSVDVKSGQFYYMAHVLWILRGQCRWYPRRLHNGIHEIIAPCSSHLE